MATIAEMKTANNSLRLKLLEITDGRPIHEIKEEMAELRAAVEIARRMLAQLDAQGISATFQACSPASNRISEFRAYLQTARYLARPY
jgi:hypothetical protein